jgi:hypothetical protein
MPALSPGPRRENGACAIDVGTPGGLSAATVTLRTLSAGVSSPSFRAEAKIDKRLSVVGRPFRPTVLGRRVAGRHEKDGVVRLGNLVHPTRVALRRMLDVEAHVENADAIPSLGIGYGVFDSVEELRNAVRVVGEKGRCVLFSGVDRDRRARPSGNGVERQR